MVQGELCVVSPQELTCCVLAKLSVCTIAGYYAFNVES